MFALSPTDFYGEIIWLGCVTDREKTLLAEPMGQLELGFAGPKSETHGGLTRPSCSRVKAQYERGTEIRNTRQLSIISEEELTEIARDLEVKALDPALFGANVVLRGIPDFSHIPPSSRLQAESGATLTVDMENRPCGLVAREIGAVHGEVGREFPKVAAGKRGVTAWVEREGTLRLGEKMRLHIPAQPQWAHAG